MNHTESVSSIKRLLLVGLFSSALFYVFFFGNVIIHRARSSMKKLKSPQQQFSQYELAKSYEENLLKVLSQIKEEKFFSENSEDGVILSLLRIFNISLQHGFYVEIGANNGHSCNTRNLRENHKWKGLLFDEFHKNSQLNLHKERVTHINVLSLLNQNHVAKQSIDLLSVDTNNADYWVIEQMLSAGYKPKILIHEVNRETPRHCVTVPKPDPNDKGDWLHKTRFYGASVCAFNCLAKNFNYTMVIGFSFYMKNFKHFFFPFIACLRYTVSQVGKIVSGLEMITSR
jgi:hypothetical protein